VTGKKINTLWILLLAVVLLALICAALYLDVLKDDNNLYYSLARTQLFFWTVILAGCYLFLASKTGELPVIPQSMLIILGISAGTTAVGTMIGQRAGATVLDPSAKSEGFIIDIRSDGSSVNIHRFQNVVFNIIFGVVFIQQVIATSLLPTFDSNMLLLLGISSGTYAGLKVTEATKPQAEPLPPVIGEDGPPPPPPPPPAPPAPPVMPPQPPQGPPAPETEPVQPLS
jgi:hypothetical protein